jgi:hypothetical protein
MEVLIHDIHFTWLRTEDVVFAKSMLCDVLHTWR